MMGFRRGHRTDSGMTLGELMIASSVLFVCLTALASLLGGSVISSRTARVRDEATNLANERIEVARSLPYDRVGLHYANGAYGDPAGDIVTPEQVGAFTVVTECAWVRTDAGRAAYKQLKVTVSWTQPMPGQVSLTTMVYGKSDIATSGDLVVKLRYREDSTPVSNATVAIVTSAGSARSVLSNATGEAFFGQADVGPVGVTVVPPAGYVVDTSTISTATIPVDQVATAIVYLQHPAQATLRVADTNGVRVPGATVTLRRADGTVVPAVVTDSNGEALFTGLLFANYTATITKAGYPSATAPFAVSVGAPAPLVPVTVTPLLGVGIQARIYDANGTPLSQATVSVRREGDQNPLQTGVSGTNGEIAFTGMTEGAWRVDVSKAGFSSQFRVTYLYDGDHDTINFSLVPAVTKGNMHITTRDKNGHLRSIRVIVSGSGYYSNNLWSDYNGSLTLTDLSTGSYQVQCYTNPASIATVIISGGQTAEVSVSQNK